MKSKLPPPPRKTSITCEEQVSAGGFHWRVCGNKAKVWKGGKGYCGVHDPYKKAERARKRSEGWNREYERDRARQEMRARYNAISAASIAWWSGKGAEEEVRYAVEAWQAAVRYLDGLPQ